MTVGTTVLERANAQIDDIMATIRRLGFREDSQSLGAIRKGLRIATEALRMCPIQPGDVAVCPGGYVNEYGRMVLSPGEAVKVIDIELEKNTYQAVVALQVADEDSLSRVLRNPGARTVPADVLVKEPAG